MKFFIVLPVVDLTDEGLNADIVHAQRVPKKLKNKLKKLSWIVVNKL